MDNNGLSAADIAAVTGNNHSGYGYPYPVMPFYGGNAGFGNGFGDASWIWIILLLALFGGFGYGNNGGFGGFGGFNNEYAWLSNGQKEIMQNTNTGFDTLHLSNQLEGTRDAIHNISTQLCNGFNGVTNQICNSTFDLSNAINNGFYGAEISANNRQIANMQQNFNNQMSTLQGFNSVGNQLANASADNRLGIANLNSTILAENCADRAALADGLKDVLINQTANTQRILDQLCNDKIDAKNEKIADLQRQLQMADLKASQIEQNAFISRGFADEVDQLYNRLSNCPVPSTPVYGRTPIFTCPQNTGCGCGNTYGNTLV